MNHYPHHIGDFAKKTKGLTLTERGAYRELLDQYYGSEKPLPLDRREVYRMAISATAAERKAVDYILGKYFVEQSDGWHNKRADEEIAAYLKRAGIARENGAKGGRRVEPPTDPGGNPGTKSVSGSDPGGVPEPNPSGKLAVSHKPLSTMKLSGNSQGSTPVHAQGNGSHKNGSESQTLAKHAMWMTNDEACLEKAKAVGVTPNPGEPWQSLRNRIMKAEAGQRR